MVSDVLGIMGVKFSADLTVRLIVYCENDSGIEYGFTIMLTRIYTPTKCSLILKYFYLVQSSSTYLTE